MVVMRNGGYRVRVSVMSVVFIRYEMKTRAVSLMQHTT